MEPAAWIALATLAATLVAGLVGLIRKITRLETEIHNGVISRVTVIDRRIEALAYQMAEMHGWMRAMSASEPKRDLKG